MSDQQSANGNKQLEAASSTSSEKDQLATTRRHVRIGWSLLLIFLSMGAFLEVCHAFRVSWYLDVGEPETRRLMWRLAHAHGALLSLVHVAFGLTLTVLPEWPSRKLKFTSFVMTAASILIPGGFFLGGAFVHGNSDPGLGVLLVPAGAALFFLAVAITARQSGVAD